MQALAPSLVFSPLFFPSLPFHRPLSNIARPKLRNAGSICPISSGPRRGPWTNDAGHKYAYSSDGRVNNRAGKQLFVSTTTTTTQGRVNCGLIRRPDNVVGTIKFRRRARALSETTVMNIKTTRHCHASLTPLKRWISLRRHPSFPMAAPEPDAAIGQTFHRFHSLPPIFSPLHTRLGSATNKSSEIEREGEREIKILVEDL